MRMLNIRGWLVAAVLCAAAPLAACSASPDNGGSVTASSDWDNSAQPVQAAQTTQGGYDGSDMLMAGAAGMAAGHLMTANNGRDTHTTVVEKHYVRGAPTVTVPRSYTAPAPRVASVTPSYRTSSRPASTSSVSSYRAPSTSSFSSSPYRYGSSMSGYTVRSSSVSFSGRR